MKICCVAPDVIFPYFRGSFTHTYEVAEGLTRLGHEVHIISRRLTGQSSHEIVNGLHIHRIYRGIAAPLQRSLLTTRKVKTPFHNAMRPLYQLYLRSLYALYGALCTVRVIVKHNLDIVLERSSALGIGALAAKITNKPLVVEIIDPTYSPFSIKNASKILTYTSSILGEMSNEKVTLVTSAANTEIFRPDINGGVIREKYGIEENPIVGYVGIFAEWHGIDLLINSSQHILREIPNAKFLMVGPDYHLASEQVQKLGLGDAYIFTGPIPYRDVPKYIAAANVMVSPYNPEAHPLLRKYGFFYSPIKLFEAMACGKPIVASSLKLIRAVITNEENGLLVPPRDPYALAQAIIKILNDAEYANRLGTNARKLVEEKYSWSKVVQVIEENLYESLRVKPR